MTDLIILAKNAPEIAIGQKNCAGTMAADQRRLFPKMGKNTRDGQGSPGTAVPLLVAQAINPASSRAEGARFENLV
jgi:hypothetical protein